MSINKRDFDTLVKEAWNQPFSGWDFGYLFNRMIETQPSWDYRQLVQEKIKNANSLLDMDTGGGEFLSSLRPFPAITCATEGYAPNLVIAKAGLEPLGVQVFEVADEASLPFADGSFDLVINRHGGFIASEIRRILKPGGSFITQQVGGRNCIKLNEVLQEQIDFPYLDWTMALAVGQLEEANLFVTDKKEEFPPLEFRDIGAVVYYLKAIPWQISDFSVEKYEKGLKTIHDLIQDRGAFVVEDHRFYIEAQKKS